MQDFRKESNVTEQANVQARFPVRTTRRTATLAQQGLVPLLSSRIMPFNLAS
jgi:hypothetical protein